MTFEDVRAEFTRAGFGGYRADAAASRIAERFAEIVKERDHARDLVCLLEADAAEWIGNTGNTVYEDFDAGLIASIVQPAPA